MRPALPLLLCAVLAAPGCARLSESRLNPLNWFGASQPVANVDAAGNLRPLVTADMIGQVADGRILIASVDALEVNRTPGGALVRATGTAASQGSFNAQLVPVSQDGGTLTLAFRVEVSTNETGPVASRQVTVARVLTQQELAGISRIRVQGAGNARVSSR